MKLQLPEAATATRSLNMNEQQTGIPSVVDDGRVAASVPYARSNLANGSHFVRQLKARSDMANHSSRMMSPQKVGITANVRPGPAVTTQLTQQDMNDLAKEQGIAEDLSSKEKVVAYLKRQAKPPEPAEGVDALRVAFNKNNSDPKERIRWDDIWPDEERKEDAAARVTAEPFVAMVAAKKSDSLAKDVGLAHVAEAIHMHLGMRITVGLDMLNKFIIYHSAAQKILDNLIENFSIDYRNQLEKLLSSHLSSAGASDEIFKSILSYSTREEVQTVGTVAVEDMQQGLRNLNKALSDGIELEVIVESFFNHDKGYLNAAEELTPSRVEVYRERIRAAKSAKSTIKRPFDQPL